MAPNADYAAIAYTFPASKRVVALVLEKPVTDDGRSGFEWIRLANGDLILGVFPRGATYFEIETFVEDDYNQSLADRSTVRRPTMSSPNTEPRRLHYHHNPPRPDCPECQDPRNFRPIPIVPLQELAQYVKDLFDGGHFSSRLGQLQQETLEDYLDAVFASDDAEADQIDSSRLEQS